jgi:hypothetical protein
LQRSVRRPEQGPSVTGGQPSVGEEVLNRRREPEQPQRVGDRRAALAHAAGHLVVGELEVLNQLLERGGLLERGEIIAV